jgi:hypothetical protein
MKVGTVTIPDWAPETLTTVREDLTVADVAWVEKQWCDVDDENRMRWMTEVLVPMGPWDDLKFWFEGRGADARLVWANF